MRALPFTLGATALGFLLLSGTVGAGTPGENPGERVTTSRDLVRTEVAAGRESPVTVDLSAGDRARMNGSNDERRYRVGIVKRVDLEVRRGAAAFGSSRGERWTGTLRSEGAAGLRVHFVAFSLAEGSALFLHNEQGDIRGPYTGRGPMNDGEFWSHTIPGDEVVLQLVGDGRFTVQDVGHLGSRFRPGGNEESHLGDLCSSNADCVENASCSEIPVAIESARDAVAHILFRSGAFLYVCSGGLLADTDDSTEISWFLTANHCVSKGQEAKSLEAFFQYTAPCGQCTDASGTPSTLGSEIVATNRTGDYTLLRLGEAAPEGTAYLGWTDQSVAFTDGTELYRIHHPKGSPQAYSEHSVDTRAGTCRSWPRGSWIYSRDVFGATEGGSSGSPVLNASGQVVGQLSGGCGYNVGDVCDAASNATVDGAFAAYFAEVAPFLDPDTGGDSCTPTDEICDDGIDNDCDGAIDGNDSDCAGSGDPDGCVPTHPKEKGPRCSGGIDEDCDGLIDGADPDCK